MKVTDLMIGDILKWKEQPGFNDEDRNMVLRVKRIYDDSIKIDGRFELYHISLFEPISLVPEILEKNGWVYIAEDKVFYSEKLKGELPWIYYITDGSNEVFRMQDFCNLQYVHQLQHALRLCGIEKEIVL